VQSSKAVGEPPLLLGMSVPLAIRDAIKASRGSSAHLSLDLPLTSERIRMACQDTITSKVLGAVEKFTAKGTF
jgi:xanthine dehydrogenase/oxidase